MSKPYSTPRAELRSAARPEKSCGRIESESQPQLQERHLLQVKFTDQDAAETNSRQLQNHLRGTLDMRAIEMYEKGGRLPEDGSKRLSAVDVVFAFKNDKTYYKIDLLVTPEALANYEQNKAAQIASMEEMKKNFPELAEMEGFEFKEFSEQIVKYRQRIPHQPRHSQPPAG